MTAEILQDLAHEARTNGDLTYPDPRFPASTYYRFLMLLAKKIKSRLSVELGVCGGGGSLHLALGNPKKKTIGVDGTRDSYPENIDHVESVCPNFVFWLGDSSESAAPIYEKYGEVDLLFIDTDHTEGSTMREWNAWHPFLSKKAIVCLDDLNRPGMMNIFKALPGEHLWIEDFGGEFGVIWNIFVS